MIHTVTDLSLTEAAGRPLRWSAGVTAVTDSRAGHGPALATLGPAAGPVAPNLAGGNRSLFVTGRRMSP